MDHDTPAAAARAEQLRALGAEIRFAPTADGFDTLASWPNTWPGALLLIRAGGPEAQEPLLAAVRGVVSWGPPGTDAAAAEGGRAQLDPLDPSGWSEAIQDAVIAPPRPDAKAAAGEAAAGPRHGPLAAPAPRVLVADDAAGARRVLAIALERAGFRVDEVAGGLEALARAGAEPYALLCLDLRMPDLEGTTVVERLRAGDGPSRAAPALIVTAEPGRVSDEDAARLGVAGVVGKPVNLAALTALVKSTIEAPDAIAAASPAA